jgi:outer membrane protein OmpA-like peptidoglycan-associated protein
MMIPIRIAVVLVCLAAPTLMAVTWVGSAEDRLTDLEAAEVENVAPQVAVASAANEQYCTADLKKVLRRVLKSCGLLGGGSVRGCQPADAKSVATMAGEDFNALFTPMKDRGGIVQFDKKSVDLDEGATKLVDEIFADQRGASYFFVVSRASPDGSAEINTELSKGRAEAVLKRLRERFNDPDLDKEVGLLWLGEEFAQLDEQFCSWNRSRSDTCDDTNLNRSAFIAWIDCTL